MNSESAQYEQRILILAPTRKDGDLAQTVLALVGVDSRICTDMHELAEQLALGCGALMLPEEQVLERRHAPILEYLAVQPPWSDLPILLLTRSGADSDAVAEGLAHLGNVTLLERPTRVTALQSAVQTALRARQRQYETRTHFVERERVADALRASELRYRTLVQQVKDYAIFMTDDRGRATSWNEGVERVLGFAESEFLGSDITESIFSPDDVAQGVPKAELKRASIDGAASNDRWMMRKDGTQFWASGITTALRNRDGDLIGFTKVMRDLTDRKRAEEALELADRRKDEFLATLAHELRNPLAPIRNSLHILQRTSDDPSTSRLCEMMERQVNLMVRLVDDLLEVSRITRGQIDLRLEKVDLATVVRNAVETSRPLIDSARHQLVVTLPDEPIYLQGDSVRLAQVFANLLNNAAKYTAEAGHIHLAARREGQFVSVSVRDDGIGIPAEMLPYVFDMFIQVDRSAARSQGGLGIGLTLVRSLVEMHGGTIEAHSAGAAGGSEFVVRLPILRQGFGSGERIATRHASANMTNQRILVVDDNRDAARSLGMLLSFLGAEVHVVNDGASALEMLANYRPAVVLLDLGMPGMDGFEVARRIRELPECKDVLLVALTGWGQAEDRRRTLEAGFDHHLVKPAEISALQSLLGSLPVD